MCSSVLSTQYRMTALIALIFTLLVCTNLNAVWSTRTWQSNLNFDDPHNWSPGRLPCPEDRMVFRASAPLALQVPGGQTTVRELVLADHMELMLPRDGSLTLSGVKHSAKCDGQDAVFKHTKALRWTDPGNWDGWNRATPDLERLPCSQEDVRFTPGTTFDIITPPVLKLGTLEVNGVRIDPMDWYDHVSYAEVARQLHLPNGDTPDVLFSYATCGSGQWCECGNEYLHSAVCNADCPLPLCKQPVKPAGFCCPFCGAYFMLSSKDERKVQLKAVMDSFLKAKVTVWHASKVGQFIQVVIVEEGEYSGDISSIADELKTTIEKNSGGWKVVQLYASGHVWYPTSFTQVLGHFLSLMVFAALTMAGIVMFYSKNWSWLRFSSSSGRPFVFARFENQSGELIVAHEQREPIRAFTPHTSPQAFDNPMYGATAKEQRNITVENPIYTELEDTPDGGSAEEAHDLNPPEFQKFQSGL